MSRLGFLRGIFTTPPTGSRRRCCRIVSVRADHFWGELLALFANSSNLSAVRVCSDTRLSLPVTVTLMVTLPLTMSCLIWPRAIVAASVVSSSRRPLKGGASLRYPPARLWVFPREIPRTGQGRVGVSPQRHGFQPEKGRSKGCLLRTGASLCGESCQRRQEIV